MSLSAMVVNGFVGDGRYICSTKPSLMMCLFTVRKLGKIKLFPKNKGVAVLLSDIRILCQITHAQQLYIFFPANYLHIKIQVMVSILP